jgi:hypothetical protein
MVLVDLELIGLMCWQALHNLITCTIWIEVKVQFLITYLQTQTIIPRFQNKKNQRISPSNDCELTAVISISENFVLESPFPAQSIHSLSICIPTHQPTKPDPWSESERPKKQNEPIAEIATNVGREKNKNQITDPRKRRLQPHPCGHGLYGKWLRSGCQLRKPTASHASL